MLVFTGGVGERSARLRSLVCARLAWLDVHIGEPQASGDGAELTTGNGRVRTFVVHAREDRQMYAEATALLSSM